MPDLLTHLVTARVPGLFLRDRRVQAFLIIGTFLPDIAAKGLYWVTRSGPHFIHPTHSIAGLFLLCYLAALFVEEDLRKAAFRALFAGSLLHVGLDLFKDQFGRGSAFLFYPFSTRAVEFSWVDAENVVLLIPIDLALLVLLQLAERRWRRVRP